MIFDMLDKRSRQVLQAVVQSYINNPEPVGSRFVTKKYALGCSPATIRNIMADLEEFGFLSQPDTSAAGCRRKDTGFLWTPSRLRKRPRAK